MTIRGSQKIVTLVTIVLLVFSFLFPPWCDYISKSETVVFIGYSWLFKRPKFYLHESHTEIQYTSQRSGEFDGDSLWVRPKEYYKSYLAGNDKEMKMDLDSVRSFASSIIEPGTKNDFKSYDFFKVREFDPKDFPSRQERVLQQLIHIDSFVDNIPSELTSLKQSSELRKSLAILQIHGDSNLTEEQRNYLIEAANAFPGLRKSFDIPLPRKFVKVNNPLVGNAVIYHKLLSTQIVLIVIISIFLLYFFRK